MFGDVFFVIIGTILRIITMLLRGINIVIPDFIQRSIENLFSYIKYFQGILPLYPDTSLSGLAHDYGIMTLFGFTLTLLSALGLLKIILLILRLPLGRVNFSEMTNKK